MYPSHRPVWPGREAIRARRRPWENCSTKAAATSASFLRASSFFWTAADFGPEWKYKYRTFEGVFFLKYDCSWLTVEESFFFFGQFGVLLAAKSLGVVRFVPLSEWSRIDGDDATFDQSLGSDQFVVGGVVDNIDNTNFSCNGFSSPGEVAWWTFYDPRYSWYNVSIDNTRSSDGRIQNRDQVKWSLEICPFPRNYIWKPLSRTKLESRTPPHHYE